MQPKMRFLYMIVFFLAGIIYLGFLSGKNTHSRLYWEYAGRIDHRAITANFPEWVQHRKVTLQPLETATPAKRPLAPYTDFSSEYPPGALLLFAAVRLGFDGLREFSIAYSRIVATCISLAALLSIWLADRKFKRPYGPASIALVFTIWLGLVGPFVVIRFDSVVVLFVSAALIARHFRRHWMVGLLLGIGASIKIWPALLCPIFALDIFREPSRDAATWRRFFELSIGALVGFASPHVVLLAIGTSPTDLFDYFGYYAGRPPQIESLLGNLLVFGQILGIFDVSTPFDFGSQNVVAAGWQTLSIAFTIGFFIAYAWALAYLHRAENSTSTGIFAAGFIVTVLILASKVFSGEYLIWILPFALYAVGAKRWDIIAAYGAALIFLKFQYWNFDSLLAMQPKGILLLTLKNVACAFIAILFAISMTRGRRSQTI